MAEREKGVRELRILPFDLAAQMSAGASLVTIQGFASQKTLKQTTLAAAAVPGAATLLLNNDPGVGALLIVHPADPIFEETLKVTGVTPSAGDFLCDIEPTLEQDHGINTPVDYEEGLNTTLLVNPTPGPTTTTTVALRIQQGADSQTYRFSVRGICNNGERVEDGTDVLVVEFAPDETIRKEPTEIVDVPVQFSDWTQFFSTTLSSATAFVARERTDNTTVSGPHSKGSTTLTLNKNPGVGALLTVGAVPQREKLLVSAVGAGPPYPCTVSPLQFGHGDLQSVDFFPGVTARLLVSSTASISMTEAIFRMRLGAADQDYWMVVLATLGDSQVVQKSLRIEVRED